MKKLLVGFMVLALAIGVPSAWAKNGFSGRSFGSSGFKSLNQLHVSPKGSSESLVPSRTAVAPAWTPPMIFWMPMPGMGSTFGSGWLIVVIVGALVIFLLVRRRRVPAHGDPDDEEQEELEMMYQRCKKNRDHLASLYVDAQSWIERLEGKIPAAQWRDWNDRYTRISVDDFTSQLESIRQDLDQQRYVTARAALFSFDEDAVAVFDFLTEVEGKLEEIG